jgi:hypothetical protein
MTRQPESEADFIRATRRSQMQLAFAVGLTLAFGVLVQFGVIPWLSAAMLSAPRSQAILLVRLVLCGLAVLGIMAGAIAFWYGARTVRQAQYPPPGTPVWRDTIIRRGSSAGWHGTAYLIAGTLIAGLCLYLVFYTWKMSNKLLAQTRLGAGVPAEMSVGPARMDGAKPVPVVRTK